MHRSVIYLAAISDTESRLLSDLKRSENTLSSGDPLQKILYVGEHPLITLHVLISCQAQVQK